MCLYCASKCELELAWVFPEAGKEPGKQERCGQIEPTEITKCGLVAGYKKKYHITADLEVALRSYRTDFT